MWQKIKAQDRGLSLCTPDHVTDRRRLRLLRIIIGHCGICTMVQITFVSPCTSEYTRQNGSPKKFIAKIFLWFGKGTSQTSVLSPCFRLSYYKRRDKGRASGLITRTQPKFFPLQSTTSRQETSVENNLIELTTSHQPVRTSHRVSRGQRQRSDDQLFVDHCLPLNHLRCWAVHLILRTTIPHRSRKI